MASLAGQLNQLPPALWPALKRVWSEALFPGPSAAPGRTRLAVWFVLLAVPAFTLYPCLGFHLLEPDEGRYAEIPREMLASGNWVVPLLQGEPYLDKPPLFYWLVMLSYRLFGVHVWAARLVPAVAVHLCILATYAFGTRILGERRGCRAALLLSVMPALIGVGRLLTLDGLLTLWVTLGLYTGFLAIQSRWPRGMLALFSIACGLGVLTKGPIALVLVLGPLLTWLWIYKAGHIGVCRWLLFALGVFVINAPWYVAMSWQQPGFLKYFFWQHNLQRFLDPFDHLQPVWYYGPILLAGLFPATMWLITALRGLLSADYAARRSPELAFCVLAGSGCVLFFSLSGCKLPTYILPAFPTLALALAVLLERGDRLFSRGQWIVGASWFLVLCIGLWFVLPAYSCARSPFREAELVRRVCADQAVTVVCYPRHCDSLSFYLERDDLRSIRSKNVNDLIIDCRTRQYTVVLFTHRHSMQALSYALPNDLTMKPLADFRRPGVFGNVPWGLCDIAEIRPTSASR